MASDSLKNFSLSFLNWIKTEMIFLSYFWIIVATLIQRYDKNHFISKNERLKKIYRLSGSTFMIVLILYIYLIIKPFLYNKMSTFEEYGAFYS